MDTQGSDRDQGIPPAAQPRATGQYPYPPAPAPVEKRSGGKIAAIIIAVVAALVLLSCCGFSVYAMSLPSGGGPATTFGDTIAVIHVDGLIVGTGSSINGYVSPEEFLWKLDQATADPNVKAIVLRVDSPGGTVAASQEIAMEVSRIEKPIIVSSADVNASGAYMISSQTDEIWALPTTAVGSIGVISEIPNIEGLLDKVGVEFQTITAGENKDTGSMYRSLTTTETALIQQSVDIAYDEFIRMVAEGRDIPEDEVRDMATGWAWSGIEAQEMGLVDELGTYNDVMERAADLGGIDGYYDVVTYDEVDFSDFLYSIIGIQNQLDRLGSLDSEATQPGPVVPR
jgi:protease-4